LWSQASAKKDVNNRINGYENCINPISNVKQYTKWIRDIRRYEIDEGVDSEELRALYDAVETFLGKGSKISYKIKDKAILVTLPNGQSLPFDLLSDGYKNAIGIVLDTAYRMIRLNPWLRKEAVKETPGILLIDEIDLHLHPSWQKRIVDDLKRTFPKMQIIATTHAPIVVSSCEANELIVLDAEYSKETEYDIKIKRTKTTKGWMAEDVLSDIMDVESSRDLETESMIKEYHRLFAEKVQEGQPFEVEGKLKELQDKLISRLPSNDPALTLAKLDILDMME
jgi:predicted ATP-binding protein involved in virulence